MKILVCVFEQLLCCSYSYMRFYRYVQTVQSHQAAYTSNLIQMMQYCPSGQFWTLRQQQQTSFALPMSPIINNNCHHGYRPNNHRSSDGSEDAYYQQVENYPEELGS